MSQKRARLKGGSPNPKKWVKAAPVPAQGRNLALKIESVRLTRHATPGFFVSFAEDEDGHLAVLVWSRDGSNVEQLEGNLSFDGEGGYPMGMRFTTASIEKAYADEVSAEAAAQE